ncbi:hypothetical protein HBI56_006290 [Parastagonospora nodorum]|uniref:DUF8004 domain-containing protein n=1 Tax=Phaeosphaeria nodorum (strain SN15 / ATCC MYA-4574 / FGSC 10173) TaxID=321614 RepID=A0A7U2EQG3_PHANO|nr:hypothetical protein HBH56_123530 [Parastagonospora nodorum]QRC91135.1 hypothetical protein JI435_300390 [Parastagonospora nodorum SN15]KAH3934937.1 hypothetical protein HBH54_049070 [Parastagonospora nodorum]KAH3950200.1 hypothetical protein HBH53_080290 [Parastagonospora nodorum]KAH3982601.1 hypothetical protein HBH51_038210 [Parastagonospora nodorum]
MVSDQQSHGSVPSTPEHYRPVNPGRSSSISARTWDRSVQERSRGAFRHSMIDDSGHRFDFFDNSLEATNRTPDLCYAMGRTSRSASCSEPIKNTPESTNVQRWAGLTRSVSNWDGLRKDPELWVQDGDCTVHLYARGASRRGPSFCIPLRALRKKHCESMLDSCYAQIVSDDPSNPHEPQQLQRFSSSPREATLVEIYIPAPEYSSRDEAFDWHITTRNFFAYVLGQPLVGRHMGQAFVNLFERMQFFRSEHVNNHQDFLAYAENQGYRDLVECTDYALASLYYAEKYKLRNVWIDAFTHCVGMADSLDLSPEYPLISRLTKALITRACLELDIHLNSVSRALSDFLQDDFSPAYLGLPQGARHYLIQFQVFLHEFYAETLGHWPPPNSALHFPKTLYKSMFYDFTNLYELLADHQSYNDITSQKPASGGICVLQNLAHFDERHKFTAQAHRLPLLPCEPMAEKSKPLSSASYYKKTHDTSAALALATNGLDADISESKIIRAYMQFERTHATNSTESLSAVDARKVRWLVIYGTLQYLTSVLRAPSAVRDVDSPEYPLCCLVAGQSSWNTATPASMSPASKVNGTGASTDYFDGLPRASIQPDCNREDHINADTPAKPLPARQSSVRSFGPLSSLSVRGSRRNSLTLKPSPHCAIIVHGYGDGLNQATRAEAKQSVTINEDADGEIPWLRPQALSIQHGKAAPISRPRTAVPLTGQPQGHTRNRTPLLHTFQLDHMEMSASADEVSDSMSRSDSTSSMGSSMWTDGGSAASSKSSAHGERLHIYKTSTADGLLGGLVSVDGTRVSLEMPSNRSSVVNPSQADIHRQRFTQELDLHPLLRTSHEEKDGFVFDFSKQISEAVMPAPVVHTVESAISDPPSPSVYAASVRSAVVPDYDSTAAAPAPDVARFKKTRGSEFISGIITAPIELRDRYNNAIKRLESPTIKSTQYDGVCSGSKSKAQTPTVTKTSHAAKPSSLRNRIWQDDGKLERRMSSFWRR